MKLLAAALSIGWVLVLSLLSGCAASDGRANQHLVTTAPATRAVAIEHRPPEVRYGRILDPQLLTPKQRAEITATAQAKCPAGRDIWMILVRSNYEFEGKLEYKATVYFTPSEPFGERLPIPDEEMRPFYFPESLSEADLVGLVDAAREVHDADSYFGLKGEPVCRIERVSDAVGSFEVYFGAQDGPLAGGGSMVLVRRSGGKFKATGGVAVGVVSEYGKSETR